MDKEYFVVTIVGPDQRGLVARITDEIVAHDANIEESRMSRLGGEFAALMLLSLSNGKSQSLLSGLERLNSDHVKVFVKIFECLIFLFCVMIFIGEISDKIYPFINK